MEKYEKIDKIESVDKLAKSKDNNPFNSEKVNSKIETIKDNERLLFNKEQLQLIWQLDKNNSKIETLYMTENWEKLDLVLDINEQTIIVWDNKIKLGLPKWANLQKVVFWENEIEITWSVWPFSWNGSASYEKFIPTIDNVIKNWENTITSSSWDIKLTKI